MTNILLNSTILHNKHKYQIYLVSWEIEGGGGGVIKLAKNVSGTLVLYSILVQSWHVCSSINNIWEWEYTLNMYNYDSGKRKYY